MKNKDTQYIAIAEESVIVRSGLSTALRRIPKLTIQSVEIRSITALEDCLRTQPIDLLIINPYFNNYFDIDDFREQIGERDIQVVALTTTYVAPHLLNKYDATIELYDSLTKVNDTIVKLIQKDTDDNDQESLTDREKEVVVCVAKGKTNKEIAEELFLSVHTVNTHRKNISKKLQINSPSGLTIYAIVNKLVDIDEIQADL